jgi:DNA repair exonuclease SbcCD ATPase subunit
MSDKPNTSGEKPMPEPMTEEQEREWRQRNVGYRRASLEAAETDVLFAEIDRLRQQVASLEADIDIDPSARPPRSYNIRGWRSGASRAETERDELKKQVAELEQSVEALSAKVKSLSVHATCACSYDTPTDVCLHHSPQLSNVTAQRDELQKQVAELEHSLKRVHELDELTAEQIRARFVNGDYRNREDFGESGIHTAEGAIDYLLEYLTDHRRRIDEISRDYRQSMQEWKAQRDELVKALEEIRRVDWSVWKSSGPEIAEAALQKAKQDS